MVTPIAYRDDDVTSIICPKICPSFYFEFLSTSISNLFIDQNEAKAVLDHLSSFNINCLEYEFAFKHTDDVVHALNFIKNRYLFTRASIFTDEPVTEEAEQLALQIMDSHFGCFFRMNSKVNALRPTKGRQITKIVKYI